MKGVYEFESMSCPGKVGRLVTGIQAFPFPLGEYDESVVFRLEARYPGMGFDKPVHLTKDPAHMLLRAGLVKELVFGVLSEKTRDGFVSRLVAVYEFLTRASLWAEGAFSLLTVMRGGLEYLDGHGMTRNVLDGTACVAIIHRFAKEMLVMPSLRSWRRASKLSVMSKEEHDLFHKICDRAADIPYVWTEADALRARDLLTPGHWAVA